MSLYICCTLYHFNLRLPVVQKNMTLVNLSHTYPAFCCADVLADNGRLPITGDVIAAFGKMMSAHRGEVLCSVTTAQV